MPETRFVVDIDDDDDDDDVGDDLDDDVDADDDDFVDDYGVESRDMPAYAYASPLEPRYLTLTSRVQSFEAFPVRSDQPPSVAHYALWGFYALRPRDPAIRCFVCGVVFGCGSRYLLVPHVHVPSCVYFLRGSSVAGLRRAAERLICDSYNRLDDTDDEIDEVGEEAMEERRGSSGDSIGDGAAMAVLQEHATDHGGAEFSAVSRPPSSTPSPSSSSSVSVSGATSSAPHPRSRYRRLLPLSRPSPDPAMHANFSRGWHPGLHYVRNHHQYHPRRVSDRPAHTRFVDQQSPRRSDIGDHDHVDDGNSLAAPEPMDQFAGQQGPDRSAGVGAPPNGEYRPPRDHRDDSSPFLDVLILLLLDDRRQRARPVPAPRHHRRNVFVPSATVSTAEETDNGHNNNNNNNNNNNSGNRRGDNDEHGYRNIDGLLGGYLSFGSLNDVAIERLLGAGGSVAIVDETGPPTTVSVHGTEVDAPRYPFYARYQTRLHSYGYWPPSHPLTKNQLADAGFFYGNRNDAVTCFHCGSRCRAWSATDDPWLVHARIMLEAPAAWPSDRPGEDGGSLRQTCCPYVLLVKGAKYVRTVRAQEPEHEAVAGPSSVVSAPADPFDARHDMLETVKCIICCAESPTMLFTPCGHLVACYKCAAGQVKCFVCRQKIDSMIKAFFA